MNMQFFTQTLPKKTAHLITQLQDSHPEFLDNFYLSGGTALSLQLGHRQSDDLDFFSLAPFSPQKLQQLLTPYGKLEQLELASGTLNTFLNGVQLQFLEYPYKLLKPLIDWQSVKLSSVIDIACTKLHTIGARGSKKDFIDLYFLLDQFSLMELFDFLAQKYPNVAYNQTYIMKSLIYFEDADKQPLPRLLKDVSWIDAKRRITQAVKGFAFSSRSE